MFYEVKKYIDGRFQLLPDSLKDHIRRTRNLGIEFASQFNVDPELVDISILGHDIARHLDDISLINEARNLGIGIGKIEEDAPILLHGPIAATWISNKFSDQIDERILEAIYFHTTGKPYMSDVGKITFLSDKLDPLKIERRPSLLQVKSNIDFGLDQAILKFIELQINYSHSNNWSIPNMLLDFRDSLTSKNT